MENALPPPAPPRSPATDRTIAPSPFLPSPPLLDRSLHPSRPVRNSNWTGLPDPSRSSASALFPVPAAMPLSSPPVPDSTDPLSWSLFPSSDCPFRKCYPFSWPVLLSCTLECPYNWERIKTSHPAGRPAFSFHLCLESP